LLPAQVGVKQEDRMRAISRFFISCSAILLISAPTVPAFGQCPQTAASLLQPATEACDLPHNDLRPTSISVAGLNDAAPFLDAIANGALNDATLHQVTPNLGAVSPDVAKLLAKIVSCALPDQAHLARVGNESLKGHVGLCPQWGTANLDQALRKKCQEVVSACVLALVNAVGEHVVLSLRGKNAKGAILQKPRLGVPIQKQYRHEGSTGPVDIPSFATCATSSSTDCGFKPYYVGRCIAKTPATANSATTASSPITVTATGDAVIRVCKGIYGCEANTATNTAQAAQSYTSFLAEGVKVVTFQQCPANGPQAGPGERWGYYSIMAKSLTGSGDPKVTVTSLDGKYPAREEEVFTYPEGAFYGNLFTKASRERTCCTRNSVLGGDEFACYSRGWKSGVAEMNERFCDSPDEDCFINKPMACFKASGDRCATDAVSGKAYSNCLDTLPVPKKAWNLPLTTYLNNPCDLSSDSKCDPDKVFPPPPGKETSTVRDASAKRH
jgi:hypothetical protein